MHKLVHNLPQSCYNGRKPLALAMFVMEVYLEWWEELYDLLGLHMTVFLYLKDNGDLFEVHRWLLVVNSIMEICGVKEEGLQARKPYIVYHLHSDRSWMSCHTLVLLDSPSPSLSNTIPTLSLSLSIVTTETGHSGQSGGCLRDVRPGEGRSPLITPVWLTPKKAGH